MVIRTKRLKQIHKALFSNPVLDTILTQPAIIDISPHPASQLATRQKEGKHFYATVIMGFLDLPDGHNICVCLCIHVCGHVCMCVHIQTSTFTLKCIKMNFFTEQWLFSQTIQYYKIGTSWLESVS